MPYKDKEKQKEYEKSQKVKQKHKQYYLKNKDKISEYNKNYNQIPEVKDRRKEQYKRYCQNNKARHNENVKRRYWIKRDDILRRAKVNNKKYRAELKKRILEHYGHKCNCCGETIFEFLTIDHINNNGKEHRKELKGKHMYVWLIKNKFPEGFQLLCMNCNWAKGRYKICPHQRALL